MTDDDPLLDIAFGRAERVILDNGESYIVPIPKEPPDAFEIGIRELLTSINEVYVKFISSDDDIETRIKKTVEFLKVLNRE